MRAARPPRRSETVLTFKGAQQPGPVKSREEIETTMGDPAAAEAILASIGFRQCFRSEKYREDYDLDGVVVIIDDTPMGVFVEIEGTPDAIVRVAAAIGRSPADFELASYPGLYRRWCERRAARPATWCSETARAARDGAHRGRRVAARSDHPAGRQACGAARRPDARRARARLVANARRRATSC